MTTWFTSDTHFGHARIIELCNRPFRDVDHMDSEIVRRWNEVVMPDDTVFHLGDVALGKIDKSLSVVSRLNGYKVLVNGNHDRPFMTAGKPRQAEWIAKYREVFQEVVMGNMGYTIGDGVTVNLSHFPYDGDSHGPDRYADARVPDGRFQHPLIHGHTHLNSKVSRSQFGSLQIHVGQDAWEFRPVSEDEIVALLG